VAQTADEIIAAQTWEVGEVSWLRKRRATGTSAADIYPVMKRPSFLHALGPGLITGAADDDPSGIATYSQVGAQFGYGMLWTMLFSYPLMAAIQEISARIGRVTGRGIAGNIGRYYWPGLSYLIAALLLAANGINLGADIGAMGATAQLLVGGPPMLYVILFACLSLVLQVAIPYTRYVSYLKWVTLALFAYVATVLVVDVPWPAALRSTFLPSIPFTASYWTALIAVLGTTLSPYLFFWQASQEAEEVEDRPHDEPLKRAPQQGPKQLFRIKLDTYLGMAFSNIVAFCIILTTAVTLHAHGVVDIQTPAQAAQALEPLAGRFAFCLFAAGIIGTGMLAIPVLGGSAAYGVAEALKWPVGLERQPLKAKRFYGVLTAATLIGLCLSVLEINPIKALFWSAVVNGIVAVPVMVVMMLMTTDRRVMGRFTVPLTLKITGWVATAVMGAAAIGTVGSLLP
jgi:NRAMP (natural resistance-associated macrophage protein)-like metal ion transporter